MKKIDYPDNWQESLFKARMVAVQIGLNHKGMNLPELVKSIEGYIDENQLKYEVIPDSLKKIIPKTQRFVVNQGIESFQDVLERLEQDIEYIPKLYGTEKEKSPLVYFHYFAKGALDWYVTEYDPKTNRAFGFVNLDDPMNAEKGYIAIDELVSNKWVELDFYWSKRPLQEIIDEVKGVDDEETDIEDILEEVSDNNSFKFDFNFKAGKTTKDAVTLIKYLYDNGVINKYSQTDIDNVIKVKVKGSKNEYLLMDLNTKFEIEYPENYNNPHVEQIIYDYIDNVTQLAKAIEKAIYEYESNIKKEDKPYEYEDDSEQVAKSQEERTSKPIVPQPDTKDVDLSKGKTQEQMTVEIRQIIDEKGLNRSMYSYEELEYLTYYEGLGGLQKSDYVRGLGISEKREILDQFFTPDFIIQKMWGLALKYGFDFSKENNILEPSCGIGRFFKYIANKEKQKLYAYELDKYSYTIAKLLFPTLNIKNEPFEKMFFDKDMYVGSPIGVPSFDIVIGNPPYRDFTSSLAKQKSKIDGMSEKDRTKAQTFDQYFIMRGIDVLKPGGLLIYIIPSSFLHNSDKYNEFKKLLALKCNLVDAYRMPSRTFSNTDIATDIIVLRKK